MRVRRSIRFDFVLFQMKQETGEASVYFLARHVGFALAVAFLLQHEHFPELFQHLEPLDICLLQQYCCSHRLHWLSFCQNIDPYPSKLSRGPGAAAAPHPGRRPLCHSLSGRPVMQRLSIRPNGGRSGTRPGPYDSDHVRLHPDDPGRRGRGKKHSSGAAGRRVKQRVFRAAQRRSLPRMHYDLQKCGARAEPQVPRCRPSSGHQ